MDADQPVVTPFRERTDPAAVADLRARLRATRWPTAPEDAGWSAGTDLGALRELVEHWAERFDWPAREAELARLPRVRVQLGDLSIHAVHARARQTGAPALPLVLCHGWPDCYWRYLEVIPLLVDPGAHGGDPADAFDVVVPDMPGFGHSPAPATGALDSTAVAGAWAELMTALGHERFGAAGGDIGGQVVRDLALDHPDRVVAVHRMDAGLPVLTGPPLDLSAEERDWVQRAAAWGAAEGAYAAVHRTKPQTAAVGLTDSPAGMAAWIVEKLRAWSDGDGDLADSFTTEQVLTLLSTYWFTGTIGSSMRVYRANAAIPPERLTRRIPLPSGFALFPGDVLTPPRAWLERTGVDVTVTRPPRGGHFAPVEEPQLYAEALRDFFRPHREALAAPAP